MSSSDSQSAPPPVLPPVPPVPPSDFPNRAFRPFAGNVGSWFGAWGMQQVLFSWIVVGELRASAEWVGITQTATMLPGLFLLPVGGALADRWDPRRLLIVLHGVAALLVIALAVLSGLGRVNIPELIVFGLSIGSVQAFSMPARDSLLSRVAGRDMMAAVTAMTAVQFGGQALGTLAAALARVTGSATMLLAQAAVLLVGSGLARKLPAARPASRVRGRVRLGEIAGGLAEVARTASLRGPTILVIAVGIFFVGPYTVIFPLLVRDHYHAGVDALSLVLMMFPLGTILGSLVLRRRGVERKGRAALMALGLGLSMELVIASEIPFAWMAACSLVWGLGGSVFINCSRTLFQVAAPEAQRGRVLAVYQLGFVGGGPIGALLAGFSADALGLHLTLVVFALAMACLVVSMALWSDVARLR